MGFETTFYPVIDEYPHDITFSGDVIFTGTVTAQSISLIEGAVIIDVTDTEALLIRQDGDTGDIFTINTTAGDITMGSATQDTGTFTMIKGEQTSDPQVQFAISDDANGNFSITADTGSIAFKMSADSNDYITLATVSNVPCIFGTGAYLSIGDASTTANSLDNEDDLLVTGELECGSNLYTGAIVFAEDSGLVTAMDMAISATPADGTEEGYTFDVDGGTIFKVRAEADSAGAVDNRRVEYTGDTGTIKQFVYQNDSIADDGTVSLPDATSGFGKVICNAEYFDFYVQSDGTIQIEGASANTAESESDGNLCIYDGGTQAIIKNMLGATGEIRIIYWYN